MDKIILLQNVTTQFCRLFLTHFVLQSRTKQFSYKVWQFLLQSASCITESLRL